jgi:hypothetical protein
MRALAVLLAAAVVVPVSAGEIIVPVFAHNIGGHAGNSWSSEMYVTNTGDHEVQVSVSELLLGHMSMPEPCNPFAGPYRVVPPRSTVLWRSEELAGEIGCAEELLGAVVLGADGPLSVSSRTVNSRGLSAATHLLVGYGQEFPGVELSELPEMGTFMLPGLVWHRNPCAEVLFDTSLGLANPGPEAASVTIDLPEEAGEGGVLIDGREVLLPYTIDVAAGSWRQLRVQPKQLLEEICLGPTLFDMYVEIDGPLAVYASVVDRTAQDPRTVYPVPVD